MPDFAARLAAALDRAEAEARAGVSDEAPRFVLRMVERDRALLAAFADAEVAVSDAETLGPTVRHVRQGRVVALLLEVERAAKFWCPEVPDGT